MSTIGPLEGGWADGHMIVARRPCDGRHRLTGRRTVRSLLMTRTDEELVARSRSGDVDSFNQLIVRWERPIYALAYRVLGVDEGARECCEHTFLRAYRAWPGCKGQAKFSSWLYRIALNLCRDWIRRQQRAPVSQIPDDVDPAELLAGAETLRSV